MSRTRINRCAEGLELEILESDAGRGEGIDTR